MDTLQTIIYVVIGVLLLWLIIKLFSTPIKWALKLLLNALLGFVMLFVFNFLGGFIGLELTVGWLSAIVAGILGIPGIILLLLIENFFLLYIKNSRHELP